MNFSEDFALILRDVLLGGAVQALGRKVAAYVVHCAHRRPYVHRHPNAAARLYGHRPTRTYIYTPANALTSLHSPQCSPA